MIHLRRQEVTVLKVFFMYENQFDQVEHQSTKICILLIYISGMVIPIESFMILTAYKKIKYYHQVARY